MTIHDKLASDSEAEHTASSSRDGTSYDRSRPMTTAGSDQPSTTMSKYMKDKQHGWDKVSDREGPLRLLDLPVDVLGLIVKEITHTNDLTSLALTNSTLHNLAVPHIYARFDIVWPDGHVTSNDSKSVDALTYGLSTLCLGTLFARTMRNKFQLDGPPPSRFTGNDYAKYTRKFCIGNGPEDWVADYMLNKESGKMLGTLVALAVSKMVSLETFVWDMPTGVLSDIFMSLASLPEHYDDNKCKLDRVWIRWHDNNEHLAVPAHANNVIPPQPMSALVPIGSTLTPIGILLPEDAGHPSPRGPISYAEHRVEYPTFSVLPPLKSLTVLEIDELAYLDEMADLIARSADGLQELRVGISSRVSHKDFAQTWDGSSLQQIDHNARWPGESTIGERRLGGVLGVLVGKIYDIRRRTPTKGREKILPAASSSATISPGVAVPVAGISVPLVPAQVQMNNEEIPSTSNPSPATAQALQNGHATESASQGQATSNSKRTDKSIIPIPHRSSEVNSAVRKRLDGKLRLRTLELERVALSLHVCRYAIDWAVLTTVTILDCAPHEALWKMLRKRYQPTPVSSGWGSSATSKLTAPNALLQYHLKIKHIHTDMTSPGLLSFIKETLAPNSLEVLFLQDRRRSGSGPLLLPPIKFTDIFKAVIRRHRSSLRKLLIDSSERPKSHPGAPSVNTDKWKRWVLPTEAVLYITSGRMSNLKELAVSLNHRDWHVFLQRLPNLPHLRSLNIPNIENYPPSDLDPKELALQITNIITLRLEIQLCYVGIAHKCFEILETRNDRSTGRSADNNTDGGTHSTAANANGATDAADGNDNDDDDAGEMDTSEEDEDDDGDDGDDTEDEIAGELDAQVLTSPHNPLDPDETQSDDSGGDDSEDDSFVEDVAFSVPRLRLREILFYDDKVAVFKARHGKL